MLPGVALELDFIEHDDSLEADLLDLLGLAPVQGGPQRLCRRPRQVADRNRPLPKLVVPAAVPDLLPPGAHKLTVGTHHDLLLASVDLELDLVEDRNAFVADLFDLAGVAAARLTLERRHDRLGQVVQGPGDLGDLALGPADAGHTEGGRSHHEQSGIHGNSHLVAVTGAQATPT